MHHRRLEMLAECEKLGMGSGTAGAAQDRHAPFAVQQRGELFQIRLARRDDWRGRQQAGGFGRRRVYGRLQSHVAGNYEYGYAALPDGLADRDLECTRHLVRAGD